MCHSSTCGGHFAARKTAYKILQSGFYWPSIFKDVHRFYTECLQCQAAINISKRDEMPMRPILEVEIFDLWGIDFMGPSHLLTGKSTCWWRWTMCPSGSKQSPPGQMTIGRYCGSSHDASSPDTVVRELSSATVAHTSTTWTSGHCERNT